MAQERPHFSLIRHPLRLRLVQVTRVTQLSPAMRRVTLGGPELEGFVSLAPEDHVKVFFPRLGEALPAMPTLGERGLLPPPGGKKPYARDYTPLHFDAQRLTLDLDFFLHGKGLAAEWARGATPGQTLGLGGPRGSYVLQSDFSQHVMVGDETALPEFGERIRTAARGTRLMLLGLVDGAEDERSFTPGEGVALEQQWTHRGSSTDPEAAQLSAVRSLSLSAPETFVWLAGEARQVRALYRCFKIEHGIEPTQIAASGHWKRGIANHDHHEAVT